MPLSGSLSWLASLHRTLSGSLGILTGTVAKKVAINLSGSLGALSGSLGTNLGLLQQAVAGTLGILQGTVTTVYSTTQSVVGSLGALGGTLATSSLRTRNYTGQVSFSGAVSYSITYTTTLTGILDFTGGTLGVSGNLYEQAVAGILSFSADEGAITTRKIKPSSGGLGRLGVKLKPD